MLSETGSASQATAEAPFTSGGVEPDEEPLGSLLVPERLAIWSWVLGYTAILSSLSVLRYSLWVARGDDLGVFEQALWLLVHHGLHAVSTYTGKPVLANAASYVLVLLAPLYAVGGVGFLLVLQAFAFGLGYYFIRRIGGALGAPSRYAHLLGVLYLLYPTVLGANLYDFHPDALGIPVLFALAWAAIEERWVAYGLLLLASLLIKDSVTVVLIGLGVALLLRRRAGWGLITLLVALAGGYLDVLVLIPRLGHGVMSQWTADYANLGPTPLAGIDHLLHHPQTLFGWVKRPRSWEYLAWLFGPLAVCAGMLGRRVLNVWWIPGLALLETNLLSPTPALTSPFIEFTVFAIPFFFVAMLQGMTHRAVPLGRRRAAAWVIPALLLVVVFCGQQYRSYWSDAPSNSTALQAAVAKVPAGAPVMTQNFILPHVADRAKEWQVAALGSMTVPARTYVILDPATSTHLASQADLTALQAVVEDQKQAQILYSKSGVTVARLLQALPARFEVGSTMRRLTVGRRAGSPTHSTQSALGPHPTPP